MVRKKQQATNNNSPRKLRFALVGSKSISVRGIAITGEIPKTESNFRSLNGCFETRAKKYAMLHPIIVTTGKIPYVYVIGFPKSRFSGHGLLYHRNAALAVRRTAVEGAVAF